MAGLAVDIRVGEAVAAIQGAFEEVFGPKNFGRAVQYALNQVVVAGVNDFRRNEMPRALRHMNSFTQQGVRYELDRSRLDSVGSLDDVRAAAFILPMQSVWLKYALGEEVRVGGDVGIEGWFPDHDQIYLPNAGGLEAVGIRPNAAGHFKGADIKRLGRMMAEGYRATGGARFQGLFEIKAGDRDPARLGVGIHARPLRGTAVANRSRVRDKMDRTRKRKVDRRNPENRYSLTSAPTTEFTRRNGTAVSVPKVVNLGVPQLLFLTRPEGHYKPLLSPGWQRSMEKAADKIGDTLLAEYAGRLERAVAKARRH